VYITFLWFGKCPFHPILSDNLTTGIKGIKLGQSVTHPVIGTKMCFGNINIWDETTGALLVRVRDVNPRQWC